eukprot:SAG31_NODE_90_length_26410_cov_175.663981_12_plen_56_part_00
MGIELPLVAAAAGIELQLVAADIGAELVPCYELVLRSTKFSTAVWSSQVLNLVVV